MLLLYSINLQAENDTIPFTGEEYYTDTLVQIPIHYIRLANDKMIERNYLKKTIEVKDSINVLQQDYIYKQDSVINILKNNIVEANRINDKIQEQYKKERNKSIIYGSIAGGLTIGIITTIVSFVCIK